MEESEICLAMAAREGAPEDMLVASRIMDHPSAYRTWEAEHNRLLRSVSGHTRFASQMGALRATTFSLIHRKALFEYIRERRVSGAKRHRLFALFYGDARDYANSVIAEHANFVRCSSSHICADHLASQLMRDAAFQEPMQLYQEWYGDYFRVFCDVALAETEEEKLALAPVEALKPLLKHRLRQARDAILKLPAVPSTVWSEVELRKATGETQKLRRLSIEQSLDGFAHDGEPDRQRGRPRRT
ncbi:MAG TPA: hypothetical protein VI653_14160 [Steroidobacteraceae bacterium]